MQAICYGNEVFAGYMWSDQKDRYRKEAVNRRVGMREKISDVWLGWF